MRTSAYAISNKTQATICFQCCILNKREKDTVVKEKNPNNLNYSVDMISITETLKIIGRGGLGDALAAEAFVRWGFLELGLRPFARYGLSVLLQGLGFLARWRVTKRNVWLNILLDFQVLKVRPSLTVATILQALRLVMDQI